MTSRSRGQAMVETALALPLFVLAMLGVLWALKAGVLGERVQLLARYAGTVTAQSNPYDSYSFYATYQAAAGKPLTPKCLAPTDALLSGEGPIQAPAAPTPKFWQPVSDAVATPVCGRAIAGNALVVHSKFTINAASDVPGTLQSVMGSALNWNATLNQLQPPDMGTLVTCYPELQNAFESSAAAPTTYASATSPADLTFPTNALALSASCDG